jgi:hypothetical protein
VPPVGDTGHVLLRVIAWLVVVYFTLAGVTLLVTDGGPTLLGVFMVGTGVIWLVVHRVRRQGGRA